MRSYPGNENRGEVSKQQGNIHGITHPGSTGVIYVMDRAKKSGYSYDDKEWSNFGQGAPEGKQRKKKKISILTFFLLSGAY